MKENVGEYDRIARIVLGAVAGVLSIAILADMLPASLSVPEVVSPVLGVVAIILLATAFTEKCAIYSALGIDTR